MLIQRISLGYAPLTPYQRRHHAHGVTAQRPAYSAQPQAYHYSAPPAHRTPTHYMSSNAPSQNSSSQRPSGDDDRSSKRVRTTEPGQAQSYPTYAAPHPPTRESQAAAASAADAYRRAQAPAAPTFSHPPTDLPPRAYPTVTSPYAPPKPPGRVTGAQMQYLPGVEARLSRLESAVDHYVDLRAKKALEKSILPGSQPGQPDQQPVAAADQQPGSGAGQH